MATVSWETIADNIATIIQTVDAEGIVVKRNKSYRDEEKFSLDFRATIASLRQGSVIYGWIVIYNGFASTRGPDLEQSVPAGHVMRRHRFTIEGLFSRDEERDTEKIFFDKTVTIVEELEKNVRVTTPDAQFVMGDVEVAFDLDTIDIDVVHKATINFDVLELVSMTFS